MKVPFRPTPDNPLIISPSEIGDFLRCRLRWNWKYRVGISKPTKGEAQSVGIIVHATKEHFYKLPPAKRTVERAERAMRDALRGLDYGPAEKEIELATAMMKGYAEWIMADHEHSDKAIGKSGAKVFPEWAFNLPLVADGSVRVRGYIDEMFEPTIHKRTLAMDETKTRRDLNFSMLDMNYQMTTYLWAMSVQYPKYKRYIAWRTVMRRQLPGPRVKAALFAREMVERSAEEIALWVRDTQRIARDMLDAAVYSNPTDTCSWDCDFYNLCMVRENKHDLKHIIDSEFVKR